VFNFLLLECKVPFDNSISAEITEPTSASGSDSSPDKKKTTNKKKRDRGNNQGEGADETGSVDHSPAQKKRKIDESPRTDQKDYLGLQSLHSDSYQSGSDCNPRPRHNTYVVHEGQRNPHINTYKQYEPQLPLNFRK